jgi:phospholipid/cholesterol/gamma-HCH transport system permease protein
VWYLEARAAYLSRRGPYVTRSPAPPSPATAPSAPVPGRKNLPLALAGRAFSPLPGAIAVFGDHVILLGRAMVWLFRRPFRARLFFDQMEFVGVGSLPIIMLVGLFTGAVTALQAILALSLFEQQRYVGFGVGISLARELAPVFTALMITARAGSGMATELASMRITEQVDALTTFAVNPVQYLVTPRLVASALMLPVMTMVFNVVGLIGCYVVAIISYQIDFGQVLALFRHGVDPVDFIEGVIKAFFFGMTMATCACYQGLNVRGGAKEVGLATTRAVVSTSVTVLVLDYFLIEIMNVIFPYGGL